MRKIGETESIAGSLTPNFMPDSLTFELERKKLAQGFAAVVGCDEVGRGCLAGPVVAAAVSFPAGRLPKSAALIRDSKLLSATLRQRLAEEIKLCARWGIAEVSAPVIDRINIHKASLLAMRRAVEKLLRIVPCESNKVFIWVDGKFTIPGLGDCQRAVVRGDGKIFSVAAASILAKVHRDRLMTRRHRDFPEYGWDRSVGYPTPAHRAAVKICGLSPLHRRSFCGQN